MFASFTTMICIAWTHAARMGSKAVRYAVLIVTMLIAIQGIEAQQPPSLYIKRTMTLDEVGDARVTLQIKMPTSLYTRLKQQMPNIAVLLRQLGNGQHWAELDEAKGQFEDMSSTVVVSYVHRGMARPLDEQTWEVPVATDGGAELAGQFDRAVIFTSAMATPFGLAIATDQLQTPEQSSQMEVQQNRGRITYRLPTPTSSSGRADADFQLDAKPQLMSCLAKAYAKPEFSSLWAARVVFRNTGEQTLEDYRVRFRIQNYSSWSRWMVARRVVPGQTVVDAFFPVFELDKLTELNGTRPVSLEVEYEYKTADGYVVRETDYRSLELLGRNEVIFSSLAPGEAVGFHDYFDYGPLLLAAFVTRDDPVIQQLAGRVSGMAGGPAAALNDEDAIKYLKALWACFSGNNIAYQTPPTNINQGQFGQHIKFGRDVLRNRAGTCIDLAILVGSACEAVGLDPVLYLVPGHCFPAVRLPGGQLLPIEATAIGQTDLAGAVEIGHKNLKQAFETGLFVAADIAELHAAGVRPLELSPVEPDYLEKLGYRFTLSQTTTHQTSHSGENAGNDPNPDSQVTARLAGKWVADQYVGNARVMCATMLTADGRYATVLRVKSYGNMEEVEETGTFKISGNRMTIISDQGSATTRRFQLRGNVLQIEMAEWGVWLTFHRVQG